MEGDRGWFARIGIKAFRSDDSLPCNCMLHSWTPFGHRFAPSQAKALPDRSVESSYRCVQRMYDAMANKGKWTADEDQMLQDLVLYHGTNWGSIAPQIGRTIGACADRWRVLERTQNELATGKWSADEDRAFASALEELTAEGRIPDSKDTSFWVEMSKRIPSRTIIQIRQKWVRQAHIQTLPDGQRTVEKVGRWNAECDFLLLGKLQALDVQDDSEIDWAKFRDDRLVWPPNKIRDGYLRLKKRVNPEEKTFAMIVADIAQYLSDRRAKRLAKIREPREPKQQLSAERVEEEWDDDDLYYEGLQLEADATFLDALERLGVRLTLPGDAAEEEANVMPWHDMGVSLSAIEGQGQGSREQAVEKGGEEDERERRKKKVGLSGFSAF